MRAICNCSYARTLPAAPSSFWEKAMLLHEETSRTSAGGPKARLARHDYDLRRLIAKGVAEKAIADMKLMRVWSFHGDPAMKYGGHTCSVVARS
jgi:hypothetical protein